MITTDIYIYIYDFIYVFEWDIFLFELWFDIYDFVQSDYVLTLIPGQGGLFIGIETSSI